MMKGLKQDSQVAGSVLMGQLGGWDFNGNGFWPGAHVR